MLKSIFDPSDIGSFQVTINYLPYFTAVCASVTNLTFHSVKEPPLHEGSALLFCLTDGDTGRTSPNSIVRLNIRKHGGDIFSAAVRQNGFPYKWVQKVCGVSDQSDSPAPSMPSSEEMAVDKEPQEFQWLNDPQMELCAQHLENIIKSLKRRFRAQFHLVSQVTSLGKGEFRERGCLRSYPSATVSGRGEKCLSMSQLVIVRVNIVYAHVTSYMYSAWA